MNTTKIWRMIAVVAIAAFAAACSDGELQLGQSANITPPPPVIKVFRADPPQVPLGGSTTIYWEVEDADSIEVASAPEGVFQFHAGPFEELSGSTQVDGITNTTDFILTASKTFAAADESAAAIVVISKLSKSGQIPLPGEPPVPTPSENPVPTGPVTSQATITVAVVAASECSVDIVSGAGDTPVNAGDPTTITWTASPDVTQVTVVAADGTPVADTFPTSGEATVTPSATTKYTVEAICADGQEKTDDVTIQVNASNIRATITANGQEALVTVPNFTDQVTVHYEAIPASAQVTVTADKPVTCEPALPTAQVLTGGMQDSLCTLTSDTRFDMIAQVGENSARAAVVVALQSGNTTALDIKAGPWAFVSEEVEIEVQADAATVSGIDSLTVGGKAVNKADLVAGTKVKARVPDLSGIPIVINRIGISTPETQHPIQSIIPMMSHQFFHGGVGDALPVTRVIADPNDASRFYYGVKREAFGEISVYRLSNFADSKELADGIGIEDPIKNAFELGGLWQNNNFFSNYVKTYPVNAIAVKKGDPNVVYVGTTGLIMYTTNGGEKDSDWKPFDIFFYARRDGYSGSHKTCAGKTQTGISNAPSSADIVSMGQICDMIAKEDGRLIVAYDRGILVTEDAAKHAADRVRTPWIGARNQDTNGVYSRDGSKVAHDLEEVGTKIFAATNSGVYVNESGNGIGWAQFVGGALDGTQPVYSIAYDAKSDMLFAGTDDGVYVSNKDSANWTKTTGTLAGPVLSLAIDPAYNQDETGPVVLAGTATGMAVTRNGGEFWSVLNSPEAVDLGEVRSVAIAATVSGAKVTYKVSAVGDGSTMGGVDVGAAPPTSEETPTEPSSSFRVMTRPLSPMIITH